MSTPPGYDASPSQVISPQFANNSLGGERHCESWVSCPSIQHNVPSQGSNADRLLREQAHWPLGHCTSHKTALCSLDKKQGKFMGTNLNFRPQNFTEFVACTIIKDEKENSISHWSRKRCPNWYSTPITHYVIHYYSTSCLWNCFKQNHKLICFAESNSLASNCLPVRVWKKFAERSVNPRAKWVGVHDWSEWELNTK